MSQNKEPLTLSWYVLRTMSGKEIKVKEMIDAACKNNVDLASAIALVLVPTEKYYANRAGKRVLKERILLSGYVFVQALLRPDVESFLQNTSNVINFVRESEGDKRPKAVPENEIKRMLGAAETEVVDDADAGFIVGEMVKVTDGPFSNFVGEISEVNADRRELTVMVKVFGRETSLKLENSQVVRE